MSGWVRRLRALPGRARLALAAAVVLSVVAVLLIALPGSGDRGSGSPGSIDPSGLAEHGGGSSTTLATGGIEIDAPEGWQPIPLPGVGFGLAVPPGWEATVLSSEGLAALAAAAPVVPDFVENAHAAAAVGGLVYAAGVDDAEQVSDVLVRAAPQTGVSDTASLDAYARDLAAEAGRSDPQVEVVAGSEAPTVRMRFTVGVGDEAAQGTETLLLGADGIVWSIVVTSDDAAIHDELAARITGTLAFAPR